MSPGQDMAVALRVAVISAAAYGFQHDGEGLERSHIYLKSSNQLVGTCAGESLIFMRLLVGDP